MKIGIVLIGISFGHGRDFRHCYQNIKSNLIDGFLDNHSISIYTCSYNSELNNELLELYKPKKFKFIDFKESHQITTYKQGLELTLGEGLDFIVSTRFDIHFHKDISQLPFDYKKFNALFPELGYSSWWKRLKFTTDNLYGFPESFTSDFIDVLDDMYLRPARKSSTDLHHAYQRLQKKVGRRNVNLISKKPELSDFNSYYSLCRRK